MQYRLLINFICAVGFLGIASVGNVTTVMNEISVKASTGGNSVGSGNVSEGKSEAEVFIETTVNGEVVTHIEEKKVSEQGEDIEIIKHVEYNDSSEQDVEVVDEYEPAEQSLKELQEEDSQAQEESQGEAAVELQTSQEVDQAETQEKSFVFSIVEFFRGLIAKWFA